MIFSLKSKLGLWGILLPFLLPWLGPVNEPAHLYLQSLPLQDDRLLVVTVRLEGVTDLYGAELQLQYDPTQLKVRDDNPRLAGAQIAPGPLLAFDDRFVAANNVDPQTGLINFVFTLLNPAPPINQAGVLATLVFEVTGNGPFSIKITKAQLVSSKLTGIPVTTTDLVLDGPPGLAVTPRPAITQPATSSPFLWSNWQMMGWLFLGLLLVLGVMMGWRFRGGAAPTGTAVQAAARPMPGVPGSATRTSVLLTEQGRRAMSQADPARAYELFSQAIELDPANAAAWLGKGQVAQPPAEKRICFERTLALEPGSSAAKKALQQLD